MSVAIVSSIPTAGFARCGGEIAAVAVAVPPLAA